MSKRRERRLERLGDLTPASCEANRAPAQARPLL